MLTEFANKFPPALCRLIASRGKKMISVREIARRSGIPKSTVQKIAFGTWHGVPVDTIDAYMKACGINPFACKRTLENLRRRTWLRLTRNTPKNKAFFAKLWENVRKARSKAA